MVTPVTSAASLAKTIPGIQTGAEAFGLEKSIAVETTGVRPDRSNPTYTKRVSATPLSKEERIIQVMKEGNFDLTKLEKAVENLSGKLTVNTVDEEDSNKHHAIFRIMDDAGVPVNRIDDLVHTLKEVKQDIEPDKAELKRVFDELFTNEPGVEISEGQYLVKTIFDFVKRQQKNKIEVWAYAAQMKALKEFLEAIMKA